MKHAVRILLILTVGAWLCQDGSAADQSVAVFPQLTTTSQLGTQPLAFTANQGQWDQQVLFRAEVNGATIWFTAQGIYHQLVRPPRRNAVTPGAQPNDPFLAPRRGPDTIETMVIKASFVGANRTANVVGQQSLQQRCNYFRGADPNEWVIDVPNYACLLYEGIYPGIDLRYYGNGSEVEYDLLVQPGVDLGQIEINYEGIESLSINEAGELELTTAWNTIIEAAPVFFQFESDKRHRVRGHYRLISATSFGFAAGEDYNAGLPLLIDPVLAYSTYLGGSHEDVGTAIAVDAEGAAYVTGRTYSVDFPVEGGVQTNQWFCDVMVAKLNPGGDGLEYSTYLGGNDYEMAYGITVDASGCAYVLGYTYSDNFPTANPFQTYQGNWDAFVTKLSSAGDALEYSTYLGGSFDDYGTMGIAVDPAGRACVTGFTASPNFPVVNSIQSYQGDLDAFVSIFSAEGSGMDFSSLLGGSGMEYGIGLALDADGYIYVAGRTTSPDFPVVNPVQGYQGDWDVYVSKLDPAAATIEYSTYLGGSSMEQQNGFTVDANGCAWVTGYTASADYPTQNPFQTDQVGGDAYVTKLSSSGDAIEYSTYLGGSGLDEGGGVAIGADGAIYIAGSTWSGNFPVQDPIRGHAGESDVFLTKLNDLGGLDYSTFLGGSQVDYSGFTIGLAANGCVYLTGCTWSSDFPTRNAFQTDQGGDDAFVAKVALWLCGDIDCNGLLNVTDPVLLVDYVLGGGPPPQPLAAGDVNCDEEVGLGDCIYLLEYIFAGGQPPCQAQ